MNVPSLKRIPSQVPSAGQSATVAFVSGPRKVRNVLPLWRVTAISKLAAAIDTNELPRSLRDRQTLSMNGESDGLSSKWRNTRSIVTNWRPLIQGGGRIDSRAHDLLLAKGMTSINTRNDVVTLINVFTVEPARQQELVDLLTRATDETIRHIPGFVSATIHKSLDGVRVTNYAQWRSREDFEAMLRNPAASPHLKEAAALATSFEPHLYQVSDVRGVARRQRWQATGAVATGAVATGAGATGAVALGALAVGACAIGSLAIGRLAIGALALRRVHAHRLAADEVSIGRLVVGDLVVDRR